MKNTKKGFTLVELLVVIAILAILASVAVVGYSAFIGKADTQAANTEKEQIKTLIDSALISGSVEITKTSDSSTSYILIAKNVSTGAITVTSSNSASTDVTTTNITSELGTLVNKLSFADSALKYSYKSTSTAETLYPAS